MSISFEASCAVTAWLRQVRRSAWRLIALCLIFRLGDAIIHDQPELMSSAPALAES